MVVANALFTLFQHWWLFDESDERFGQPSRLECISDALRSIEHFEINFYLIGVSIAARFYESLLNTDVKRQIRNLIEFI